MLEAGSNQWPRKVAQRIVALPARERAAALAAVAPDFRAWVAGYVHDWTVHGPQRRQAQREAALTIARRIARLPSSQREAALAELPASQRGAISAILDNLIAHRGGDAHEPIQ